MPITSDFALSPDVAGALNEGRPVVALESSIITHGMPFPRNLETALSVERMVTKHGAMPATIAIIHGRVRIGLLRNELEALASGEEPVKASRRDLAAVLARKETAGTTVAATMVLAHKAGIGVFATGGIGGVHRGAENTFDISADLDEFARTPVAVVSSGAKSILDLPKTLEYLETRSVPVIGYQTEMFPAFFSRSSGLPLTISCAHVAEVADIIRMQRELGLGGALVANAIPEEAALPDAEVETALRDAMAEADAYGVTGKALTPFLLDQLVKATGGRTLDANAALVKSNARLAAKLAVALTQLG